MRLQIIAIASLAALPAGAVRADDAQPKRSVAIFAHPDDELFVAPALARAVRQGQDVTLVYATNGDQGPGVSGLDRGERLAALRKREALCAAEALGIETVHFFDLGDGTLGNAAHHPNSSARKFTANLTSMFANEQFDIVVTWGPDGGYGHSDHRMASVLITELVQAMDAGRPALLYPGIRKGTLPSVPEMQAWAETYPQMLTLSVSYEPQDLAAATKAAQCHETQFDAETRAGMMELFDQSIWQGAVHFRSAFAGD